MRTAGLCPSEGVCPAALSARIILEDDVAQPQRAGEGVIACGCPAHLSAPVRFRSFLASLGRNGRERRGAH
jgi:hypothetical protein